MNWNNKNASFSLLTEFLDSKFLNKVIPTLNKIFSNNLIYYESVLSPSVFQNMDISIIIMLSCILISAAEQCNN